MTIPTHIRTVQQAIRTLSRLEREELAEWILSSPVFEVSVGETAPPYGGRRKLTVEEYLHMEEDVSVRHEYVAGQIFAMSSPLIRHELITTNVLVQLRNQLCATPCRAWSSPTNVRLQVDQEDITEAIDRREKALTYRHIPSLEEYLVIAQRSREVTVFRRSENWIPQVLTALEDVFDSCALEVNIALTDIYAGVR